MASVMPDFEAWAVFAQVAECKSFTQAAKALGLSSSTVSKAISRLERRLGATLFHRTTRTLSLTPTGQGLVGRAAALLRDAMAAEDLAREQAGGPRGLVRVSSPHSFGVSHVAPLLPALADAFPDVSIELDLNDSLTDLVASGIDIGIRIGWLADSSLKARKLATLQTVVVAAPEYLEREGVPATPSDLAGHATIGYTHLRPHGLWVLENQNGDVEKVFVRNILLTNSGDAMMPLLRAGKALSLLPLFLIHRDLDEGRLVRVLNDWRLRPAGLYLVTPLSGPRPSRVTAVMDFFTSRLAALARSM